MDPSDSDLAEGPKVDSRKFFENHMGMSQDLIFAAGESWGSKL